jgi:hypothetical protein
LAIATAATARASCARAHVCAGAACTWYAAVRAISKGAATAAAIRAGRAIG